MSDDQYRFTTHRRGMTGDDELRWGDDGWEDDVDETQNVAVEGGTVAPSKGNVQVTERSGSDLSNYTLLVEPPAGHTIWSDAATDGSDLSFTDANDAALDHWIQYWDASAEEGKVWVNVPSIPANGTVYVNVGVDSGAASTTNAWAYSHDFDADGMTGIDHWGRKHDLDGGGLYDPYSGQSGGYSRCWAGSCSYKGVFQFQDDYFSYDMDDWEVLYRVRGDGNRRNSHDERETQHIVTQVQHHGNYNDDMSDLGSPRCGIRNYTDVYVSTHSGSHTFSRSLDNRDTHWVRTKTAGGSTWTKFWTGGLADEPDSWTASVEESIRGNPCPAAYGTCKGDSRWNEYRHWHVRDAVDPEPAVAFE